MNQYGLSFHHLGLAVKTADKAVKFLTGLGYCCGPAMEDKIQNVNLLLCHHDFMPAVEIIYPTKNTEGPLSGMLKNHAELIYHICFETTNLEETLNAIKENGRVICVSPPKPAILFSGKPVSFWKISGFGLVEILERCEL